MDPFLNLDNPLNLGGYELAQILEGRAAILSELDRIGGDEWANVPDDQRDRFNGLADRLDELDAEVSRRNQAAQRAERRNRVVGGGNPGNTGGGQRQRGNVATPAPPRGAEPEQRDILDPESLANYSLIRGLRSLIDGRVDGFELEVQQELEQRRGVEAQGLLIPWNLPAIGQRSARERRDVTSTSAAGLVPTIQANTMIDILRNRMMLVAMGAQVLTDMVGTFEIPKKTAGASHYWVAEGGAPTEDNPTVGQVAFAPETIGTFVDVTRRLIKQSSFDAEALMRADIFEAVAVGLDLAGVNGSGASNQPEGILQNSGVPTVAIGANGGAIDWAKVVELESTVAASNADIGSLGYLTSAKGRGQMKTIAKEAGQATYLWNDNMVNGYNAGASNQVPSNLTKGSGTNLTALIFGNFADAVFAMWGGIDITADTATLSTSGGVRLVALADAQFKLRRDESFAKIVDITTT